MWTLSYLFINFRFRQLNIAFAPYLLSEKSALIRSLQKQKTKFVYSV
jgi:hypothetical protein